MASQQNVFLTSSSFPNLISHKLDDSTFVLWRQQVEPVIKSHCLQRFVINPQSRSRFLSEEDHEAGIENHEYEIIRATGSSTSYVVAIDALHVNSFSSSRICSFI